MGKIVKYSSLGFAALVILSLASLATNSKNTVQKSPHETKVVSPSPATPVIVRTANPPSTNTKTIKEAPISTPSPSPTTPKVTQSKPLPPPTVVTSNPLPVQSGYTCNCAKTCPQISTCAEAQFQLHSCGCGARDNDGDGTACDGAPLHCQN